ncbi:hypothetical protein BH09PSE3_BH09PSE3_15360 [soil metagenome]
MNTKKPENIITINPANNLLTETTDHPVDRPGCDFRGSTGLTTAGLGLGLGNDSSNSRLDRSLPGRRFTGKLSLPRWRGPDLG